MESFTAKSQEVFRTAQALYQQGPDWITFFREILGMKGAMYTAFSDEQDRARFEQSQCYTDIQQMLANLRLKTQEDATDEETRVITVRLPKSLHESLRSEAHDQNTSLNKLCISKLLQALPAALTGGNGDAGQSNGKRGIATAAPTP